MGEVRVYLVRTRSCQLDQLDPLNNIKADQAQSLPDENR